MTEFHFRAGDTLAYRSVTQGHLVVWTRHENGEWHASDENWTARGPASDSDAAFAMQSHDTAYTPAPPIRRLSVPGCPTCDREAAAGNKFFPPHDASQRCESGKYTHCTCDTCF